MPFPHEVFKTQRIVPLRFLRAVSGIPVTGSPDIDDRGYFRAGVTVGNDHGHVVGVAEGSKAKVKLQRVAVEDAATLFATSSNSATMTVTNTAAALPGTRETIIEVTGVKGSGSAAPNTAKLQIRHGSATGPIIGELSVWVLTKLDVKITPHNVTIRDASGTGIASAADIGAVMDLMKVIWEPCGVSFTINPIQNDVVTFRNAGRARFQDEVNTLLATNFIPNTINAYFIDILEMPGVPGALGAGFSRPNSVAFGTPNPGIITADRNMRGFSRADDVHSLGNTLAHEVGHFFTLEHPDRRSPTDAKPRDFRFDTWTLRMLMHNFNTRPPRTDWRNDVGYGVGRRGALVTMKDLVDSGNPVHHSTDNECVSARTAIVIPPGPF